MKCFTLLKKKTLKKSKKFWQNKSKEVPSGFLLQKKFMLSILSFGLGLDPNLVTFKETVVA